MKRCHTTHHVQAFGEIPAGSLWDDDSPYITDDNADMFDDEGADPEPEPAPKPVRKFKPKGDD